MSALAKSESAPDLSQVVVAAIGALLPGALYIALYLALPRRLPGTPIWLPPIWLPLTIAFLLVTPALVSRAVFRRHLPYRVTRSLALALLGVVTATLVGSLALLVSLVTHHTVKPGALLLDAALLWGLNVFVFAIWYWEVDGGGPLRRHRRGYAPVDYLFPQQARTDLGRWRPGWVDYLFLAFCFATALSPADTMPLTHRAKLLMMVEALISLLILVLLVARSVNII
jgi:hypothetical protein